MSRLPVALRVLVDAWDMWMALHPHWAWLYRLSKDWGNPLCVGYCFGWSGRQGVYGFFIKRFDYMPGDWFAHHPRVPRKAGHGWWSAPRKRSA